MTENIAFFISPAYSVPPMMISFRPKCTATNTSLRVASISGTAWKPGASTRVKSGTSSASLAGSRSWMNMLRTNRLCQARSVTIRTFRR